MRSITRTGITALTAAIALSLGAVPAAFVATSGIASGDTDASVIDLTAGTTPGGPAGMLTLRTGSVNQVVYTDSLGAPKRTQSLSKGKDCLIVSTDSTLTPTLQESLLAFTGSAPAPGLQGDRASLNTGSIGVAEKKSGTSCSRVDSPGEVLTLGLNPAHVKSALGPLLAASASLDVELKQSARILATAIRGGEEVAYFDLAGASVPKTTLVDNVDDLPYGFDRLACGSSADNGPDSGASDNCQWPIAAEGVVFDTLTLRAVTGSFSLEGGADGGSTQPSTFELVEEFDGMLGCGGTTVLREGAGSTPDLQVRRLSNAGEAPEDCVEIPYTLRNGESTGQFLKPLDEQVNAQFVMDFVWTIPVQPDSVEEGIATPVPAELPVTTVDFEVERGRGQIQLGWCPDPVIDSGVLTGIANPSAVVDMEGALDNKQYACIGVRTPQVVGDEVRITEQIYLIGDVRMRLP